MQWTHFVEDWPRAYRAFSAQFAQIDPATSASARASQTAFAAYVADRHDLTHAEALEGIDDVIARAESGPDLPQAA